MYRDYGERFDLDHQKRMHLFATFEARFECGTPNWLYLLGAVNHHLLCQDPDAEIPSFEETAVLGRVDAEKLQRLAGQGKWINYFAVGLFNHFCGLKTQESRTCSALFLENASAISKKSECEVVS